MLFDDVVSCHSVFRGLEIPGYSISYYLGTTEVLLQSNSDIRTGVIFNSTLKPDQTIPIHKKHVLQQWWLGTLAPKIIAYFEPDLIYLA